MSVSDITTAINKEVEIRVTAISATKGGVSSVTSTTHTNTDFGTSLQAFFKSRAGI